MKYFVEIGGRTVEVDIDGANATVNGRSVDAELVRVAGTPEVQAIVDGEKLTVAVESHQGSALRLVHHGAVRELTVETERARHIRLLTGSTRTVDAKISVKAPMPGLVLRVMVASGQQVVAGQPLLALEAMKMENELKATGPGTVTTVAVAAGNVVEKGKVLLEIATAPGRLNA